MVNINRYNPHKQKPLGFSSFESAVGILRPKCLRTTDMTASLLTGKLAEAPTNGNMCLMTLFLMLDSRDERPFLNKNSS